MKKIIMALVVALMSTVVLARPHHGRSSWGPRHPVGHAGYFRGVQVHPNYHRSGSYWGRGGRNFLPAFAGGVVGGIVGSAIAAPAPVYTTPVYQNTTVITPVVAPVVTTPVATGSVYVPPQSVYVNGVQITGVQTPATVQTTIQQQRWIPGQYLWQNGQQVYIPGHWE